MKFTIPSKSTIINATVLILATIGLRMWPAVFRLVPFGFDHGKDSIAILSMLVTHTPKLIGPWTSIPGLFSGPGWYYLLLPAYAILRGDPVGAVWSMIFLSLVQVLLVHKVWGFRAAIIVAVAPIYLITSSNAWNPYPMTFLTFALLAILWKLSQKKALSNWFAVLLGCIAGLGFHFSAAFAIFYLPFIAFAPIIFLKKQRVSRLILVVVGTLLTFVPQLIFELRHSFVETKALISYFMVGEPHTFSFAKIMHVLDITAKEVSLAIFPVINGSFPYIKILNQLLVIALSLTYGFFFYRWFRKNKDSERAWLLFSAFFLTLLPLFGFFFLHFNVWYVYGMAPIFTLCLALILKQASRRVSMLIMCIFVATAFWNLIHYLTVEQMQHRDSGLMLHSKEETVQLITSIAAGKNYSVFTFAPDIYDYGYQYLWFRNAYLGQPLPIEFSYQKQTNDYITDKPALLARLPQQKGRPELIFYIIEKPGAGELFDAWYGQQAPSEVIGEYWIGSEVRVLVTKPNQSI